MALCNVYYVRTLIETAHTALLLYRVHHTQFSKRKLVIRRRQGLVLI